VRLVPQAQEGNIDQLAVGRWRGARVAIELVARLKGRVSDLALPENLAVLAVEAQQDAVLLLEQARGHEDAVAVADRGGMAVARNLGAPSDVVGGAPLDRQVLLGGRPIEPRPAPGRPVFRE